VTPEVIYIDNMVETFACGGDLKSSFALSKNGRVFMSQHFGDLSDERAISVYKTNKIQMQKLLNIHPKSAVCDLHPNYISSELSGESDIDMFRVQHHFAHAASVMAEHRLDNAIGVTFDGTGFGYDGGIWGGEFLLIKNKELKRMGHISEIAIIGGDESMKQAWKTVMCYKNAAGIDADVDSDTNNELVVRQALSDKINCISTTSMGRLFDAVSSILELCKSSDYEGQAAILLENAAVEAIDNNVLPIKFAISIDTDSDGMFIPNTIKLFKDIFNAINESKDTKAIALGFHIAVAEMVANVCKLVSIECGIKSVCLSGGVFQNQILTELAFNLLENSGLKAYINSIVPPNDGGIALGQIFLSGGE
jgi:hydrogenase maturation protein HypF